MHFLCNYIALLILVRDTPTWAHRVLESLYKTYIIAFLSGFVEVHSENNNDNSSVNNGHSINISLFLE